MKRIFALLLFLGGGLSNLEAAPPGPAVYIAQTAQGGDTGADAADAHSLAWLNTAGNWGSGANQVAPGTTVHLVGTLTTPLVVPASGTAGNPITIYFESNAMFSAPTLPANSAWITIDGQSWITVDGGANGAIQLTDNGTLSTKGGTFDYGNPVTGIYGAGRGVNHVTIQNLAIQNLYQRQTNTDGSLMVIATYLIGSDVTYSNLFINASQGGICHSYTPTVASNVTIVGCTISNYNHGVEIGAGQSVNPMLLNLKIIHNTFQSGDMYESPDGVELGLHRNAIFLFNESGAGGYNGGYTGCISNIVIAYNYIQHGVHPLSHTAGSGAMFFDLYDVTEAFNVMVYNNVSTLAAPLSWSGGGGYIAGAGTHVVIANNSAIGWMTNGQNAGGAGGITGSGTNIQVYNNLVQGSGAITLTATIHATNGIPVVAGYSPLLFPTADLMFSNSWSDFNIFNFNHSAAFYEFVSQYGGPITWQYELADNLAGWRSLLPGMQAHLDPDSTTNVPVFIAGTFVPASNDTVAKGNGTNLYFLGITNDFNGNPRPISSGWTIGAFESGSVANTNSQTSTAGSTNSQSITSSTPVTATNPPVTQPNTNGLLAYCESQNGIMSLGGTNTISQSICNSSNELVGMARIMVTAMPYGNHLSASLSTGPNGSGTVLATSPSMYVTTATNLWVSFMFAPPASVTGNFYLNLTSDNQGAAAYNYPSAYLPGYDVYLSGADQYNTSLAFELWPPLPAPENLHIVAPGH